jgi:hypothetical protein
MRKKTSANKPQTHDCAGTPPKSAKLHANNFSFLISRNFWSEVVVGVWVGLVVGAGEKFYRRKSKSKLSTII